MTSTAATPTPEPALDAEIEAVLHDGVLAGHLPAVQVLRRSLELTRGLCARGVVAGEPGPATPSRAPGSPGAARQPRPRFSQPRCRFSHPEKGPCTREPHPGTPRAHAYGYEVVESRAESAPAATFDAA